MTKIIKVVFVSDFKVKNGSKIDPEYSQIKKNSTQFSNSKFKNNSKQSNDDQEYLQTKRKKMF